MCNLAVYHMFLVGIASLLITLKVLNVPRNKNNDWGLSFPKGDNSFIEDMEVQLQRL